MLGIVQGRLSYSGRKLQSFPKNPFKEFKIASKIGYDFIEFFGERVKNDKNPIWSESGIKKYIKISKQNDVKIFSFCDDYIINHSLSSKKTLATVINTVEKLSKLKIKKYILPLYGNSQINFKNKNKIYKNLSIISHTCKKNNMELLFESNMSPEKFEILKKNINSKNCFFLFDTGNRILLKKNPVLDIYKFKKNIRHIHLKDKNIYNKNVIFGEGKVDFKSIFVALKKIKYKGSFTIESQRGKDIEFQATKNYIFFKKLINEYIIK
jgi:sugar phosphate isomerase/epimerase